MNKTLLFLAVFSLLPLSAFAEDTMQNEIVRIAQDQASLDRFWTIDCSPNRAAKFEKLYKDELQSLEKMKFDKLDRDGQLDFVLLKDWCANNLRRLILEKKADERAAFLVPFQAEIIALEEARQLMMPVDPQKAAATLNNIAKEVAAFKLKAKETKADVGPALRSMKTTAKLARHLQDWYDFYKGYDPLFTWWCEKPYDAAKSALQEHQATIRAEVLHIRPDNVDAILGEPIGREALLEELKTERIRYSPEELIEIANKEFAWCEAQMKAAAKDLGFEDDWKAALEHVKNLYVPPGEQPKMIRELALYAIDYVKKRDMLTVPQLAEETWRMAMMSPERQKVSPFFLGGETILVSYPTSAMDYDAKLMSMRGNNPHFCWPTVQHELIPGHHMQQFMTSRYRPYRQLFGTPFWVEGWALYWEFLLWDRGFARGPEDRVGMLFWRMHRCARIIFSLKFHLGQMTPQQCVEMLVDKVGHERSTAEGEVRRSFGGDYIPLYQCAYMLGAMQLWDLRRELVDSGKMKEKDFHNRILQANEMPIELLRAYLSGEKLSPDYSSTWRFADHR